MTDKRCPACGGRLEEYDSVFREEDDGSRRTKAKRLGCEACGGYFTEDLEPVDEFGGTTQ
jgi:hypothetical protein